MRKNLQNWVVALGLFAALAVTAVAGTYSSDFEDYLVDNQSKEMVGAIITMADQLDLGALKADLYARRADRREWHEAVVRALQEKATYTQAQILAQLEQLHQQGLVESYQGMWLGNLVIVNAAPAALDILVQREDVLQIDPDYFLESEKPLIEEADEPLIASVEIGLDRIRADEVWAMGITGEGRLVSHLDTGVDGNHPALNARWRGYDSRYENNPEWAWFDPVTNTQFPFDAGSHGTHTMGTICGLGESTGDTIGVAFGAEWMSAGVIDRVSIPQTVQDALLSFQWLADPDGDPSTVWDVPDVCSNSWGVTTGHGYPPCDQTFWVVLDDLEAAGVIVVFAAGNEGPSASSLRRPADRASDDVTTFAVGALDGNDPGLPIASFSSRGPSYCTPDGQPTFKPEVSAPGVNVRSSVPGGGYQGGWSGTSMACPHVAGVVALMRQANPNLTSDQVKQILLDTATDLGQEGEDNNYGMGIVDAYAAVQIALAYLEGWGTLAGLITDQASGDPIFGAIVNVLDRPWQATSRANGWYYLFMPADTVFNIKVENPPTHLPIFDSQSVIENDTTIVNYALEGKVTVTLTASFANPEDISYRSFYFKGSWDNDGFYDASWSGDYVEVFDDGEGPDEIAGDGIFTAEILLARDTENTYSWAIYTENYGGEDANLDDGADFDIPDLNPPTVPTLVVNPSGSDNEFGFSAEGDNGLSLDLLPGVDNRDWKWGASDSLYEGTTYTFSFHVMHSSRVTYGSGGVGGADIQFSPDVTGAYDIIFNDNDDSYLIQLTGTEGPPTYLSAQSGLDGHIPVGWLAPGTTESQEMAYDDGFLANGYYYYAASNLMATMFAPESYPVSIDSVMVHVLTEGDPYWPWPDGNHDPVGISIYVDDGSGYPEPDPVFYTEATCQLGQWIRVNVDEIVVTSGYFWVAMNNLSDYGPYDGMGLDANTDYPANKWAREDGTWSMQDIYTGDHMIRAKVFGGGASSWVGYDGATPAEETNPAVTVSHNAGLVSGTSARANKIGPASGEPVLSGRLVYHPHILSERPLILDTQVLAGYNLYRDTSPAPFDRDLQINSDLITDTYYDDWGADPYGPIVNGVLYYYQASAVYDIGGGDFVEVGPSNEATGMAENHPPEAPVNLTGDVTDHTVTLNWDPNTDYDIASYDIYRRDYNQQDFNLVGNVTHPTTTFSEVISIDGIYRYKIKAVDTGGMESDDFSNYIDMAVGLIPPGVLSASDDREFEIELRWRNPGGLALDIEDLDIGVVHADYSNAESEVVQFLLNSGEVTSATFIDARNSTPTLDQLEPFDMLLVWSNYQYQSPSGIGDVLADYVDLGKGVVVLEFSFTAGWGMTGRFISEYSPFGTTSFGYTDVSLGEYDAGHPIMEDVTSLGDYYVFQVPVQNNAEVVASWSNGWPAVGVNSEMPNVVCINGYIGYPDRQWTGDMMQLVLNSVMFVSGGQGVVPDGFKLYKSDNESGPFVEIAALPGEQNEYSDTPVPNGVPYYYQVTAVWDGDESAPSNTAMGMGQNYPPEPPYNLEAEAVGRDVNMTWSFDDDMGDLDYFAIYRKLMPYGEWTQVGTSEVTSYTDNVAEGEDGTYGYVVTAIDDGDPPLESAVSNTAYALVGTLPPNGLMATSGEEFAVPLRWMLPGSWSTRRDHTDVEPNLPVLTSDFKTINDGSDLDQTYKGIAGPSNPPVITDQGGPDAFGYTWIDSDEPGGPVYAWRDITDIGEIVPITNDDHNVGPIDIGFDFPFYGETFSTFNMCSNGWISFTSTDANYYNQPLPDPTMPLNMVAPFWDDLYPPYGGEFWYYSDGSECVISYINVPHIGTGGPYTFQIILRSTGTIFFQYETMNDPLNSCTIGIQNGDGSIGLQVVYDAVYVHSNMAIRIGTGPEGVPPVHYNLYRSTSSPVPIDPGHLITSDIAGEETAYTDTYNIVNGTTYFYTMTATWPDSAESPGSNEAEATPANHPPEAPTDLEAVVDYYDVNLTWAFTNQMGDLDHYAIYRRLVENPSWTQVGTSDVTSYTDVVTPGEDGVYAYAVTAVDNGAPPLESPYSGSAFAPVGNLPPLNLVATSNQNEVVPLSWSEPGLLPCTTLAYDDGFLANAYYYYAADNIMANHFMAPAPVQICTLWVHVLTEGDPYWPWPDGNHDPVHITVWEGDGSGYPGAMIAEQIATAEFGEWITVAFDSPVMCNTDNFWVGMNNLSDVGPYDGIGLDDFTDFPQHKWAREYGVWQPLDLYSGDHMIRAAITASGMAEVLTENNPISNKMESAKVEAFARLTMDNNSVTPRPYDTEEMLGYYVYRDTSPGVPIDDDHRITADYVLGTTYDDETVVNGTTYYYIVLAVYDNDGDIEFSPPSNEVSATPMTPGMLAVDPTSIDTASFGGEVIYVPMTLSNDGGLPVTFDISAQANIIVSDIPYRGNSAQAKPTRYSDEYDKSDLPDDPENPPVVTDFGGPDAFGYTWIDSDEPNGPTYSWVDITGIGDMLFMSDDDNQGPFGINFPFSFYGQEFNTFRVCSNGWISFTSSSTVYWNNPIPSPDAPENLVAPFWDDMNPYSGGMIYYYTSDDSVVVSWIDIPHFGSGGPYTYQVILTSNGHITFQYMYMMEPTNSATIGIQDGSQTIGLQVAFDQYYIHDEMAIEISTPWLDCDHHHGEIPAGQDFDMNAILDATSLDQGLHEGTFTITGYDMNHDMPVITVPVTLDVVTGIEDGNIPLPAEFALEQNYPNPFNARTEIRYALPVDSEVKLEVYNVLGQKVSTLVDGEQEAGYHTFIWDGTNGSGEVIASGMYFYKLITSEETFVKKMLLLK